MKVLRRRRLLKLAYDAIYIFLGLFVVELIVSVAISMFGPGPVREAAGDVANDARVGLVFLLIPRHELWHRLS